MSGNDDTTRQRDEGEKPAFKAHWNGDTERGEDGLTWEERHGMVPPDEPVGGKYFQAAGIVLVAFGLWVSLVISLGQAGVIGAGSSWPMLLVAAPIIFVAHRFWRQFELGLKHFLPFLVVAVLLGLLIAVGS